MQVNCACNKFTFLCSFCDFPRVPSWICPPAIQISYLSCLSLFSEESNKHGSSRKLTSSTLALKLVPGLFSVELHTAKQLRHFRFTIATYLSSLLSSSSFLNQVAALSDEATHELEPVYKDLIENLLIYVQYVHQIHEQQPVKYWSVIHGLAYDILDKVLMSCSVRACNSGLFIMLWLYWTLFIV